MNFIDAPLPCSLERGLCKSIFKFYGLVHPKWEENFCTLLAHRLRTGSFSLSKADYPTAGKWVENLRNQGHKDVNLKRVLDCIKFDWNSLGM